jgi:hypothetical protein
MDGRREASAHSIVFQARAGTPELNCCSANAPRGLGMLSEWGVMQSEMGLVVNFFGPGRTSTRLKRGTPVVIEQETQYPWQGHVALKLALDQPTQFPLALRIPHWSKSPRASVNGETLAPVAGSYLVVDRNWSSGDVVTLEFDLPLRYESGDLQAHDHVSLYRGPILLAYDQTLNDFDAQQIAPLNAIDTQLQQAHVTVLDRSGAGVTTPWLIATLSLGDRTLKLCDFASAGAAGTTYRSWLPAAGIRPATPVLDEPVDGAAVPAGRMLFTWRRSADQAHHQVIVAPSADFSQPALVFHSDDADLAVVPAEWTKPLAPGSDYYWKVIAENGHGSAMSAVRRFRVNPQLPPFDDQHFSRYGEGPDAILIDADLARDASPAYGQLADARQVEPAGTRGLSFDGRTSRLIYGFKRFPERELALAIWCRLPEQVDDRLQQIVSAWCTPGDDPLRLCLDRGQLHIRAESSRGSYSSDGITLAPGKWHHLAVVKSGPKLTLYVAGEPRATLDVPAEIYSSARDLGIGANPHFTGNEYFRGELRGLKFYARALSPDEVARLAQ